VKINIQFFSRLRDVTGKSNIRLELPYGSTVADALALIYCEHPELGPWDPHILIALGVEFARREQLLHDGALLSIMPPVQGG
jgi:molybdopterin converting factor small subunit